MKLHSLALLALLAAGCGGGSSSPSPAKTDTRYGVLTVRWPDRGRLIPLASNSLVATLFQNGQAVASQTVIRPDGSGANTTQTTFSGLAYGSYTLDVRAYPAADGTGTAQAVGAGTMTVTEDQPGAATVALASTVAHLSIVPAVLDKGATLAVDASATDADGNVVLLSAGDGEEALTWSTLDTHFATVTGTGPTATLKGVHSGATTVTATLKTTDAGATVSTTAPVTVNVVNDGTGTVTIQ